MLSCTDNKQKQEKPSTEAETSINEALSIETNNLCSEEDSVENKVFDIQRFQLQCDSLLKRLKGDRYSFKIKSDTFNYSIDNPEVFNYGHGIFGLLYLKKSERIVRHYIYEPKTRKQFRIYLVEALYTHSSHLDSTLAVLKETMNNSLNSPDSDHFFKMRLSPVNDYVITSDRKLYWMNASYPYSNEEFLKFIDVLKNNLDRTKFKGKIICLFGSNCKTENVP